MEIRKSTEQDFDRIMKIYEHARAFMAEHGNPNQWGPTSWPPEELIHQDIENGDSYVCMNDSGDVVGVFYYVYGERIEPTYNEIVDGSWVGEDTYGVVHRIASDGSENGIGSTCIMWAFNQCGHLRMDTHSDNKVMQNLLTKLGFRHCGTIFVYEDRYPRLAYEKTE